jgi:transcription elongation factor Elf1
MPVDYKKYPSKWLEETRPRILARANDKCEICGLKHKQIVYAIKLKINYNSNNSLKTIWFRIKEDAERENLLNNLKEVKVILTIAHLDHDELNHNVKDKRLMAMCQICHLRYDAKEKQRRRLVC